MFSHPSLPLRMCIIFKREEKCAMFRFSLCGGGWEKGTLGKKIPCQLSETRFPCTRARVDSLKLLLFICEKSAGGRRWRRFGSLSRNIHEGRYVEEILLCLFFRLFVCSPNYSLFSEKKWGRGKLANSIPFVFFPPFPQVNLSIGRFVYFPTFLHRIFSLFLKFVETSRKVENENFGDGGNELEPSTYRDTRIFL